MECSVCKSKSSVGYCVECQSLLCEDCAIICSRCGKLICSQHIHETRSGKQLCVECMEERRRRRAKREAQGGEDDLEPRGEREREKEEEERPEEAILLESARKPTPPWQLSMYSVGTAILLGAVLYAFPSVRYMSSPWWPMVMLVVTALGMLWSVIGLMGTSYVADRTKCVPALFVGALVMILTVGGALNEHNARKAAQDAEAVGTRTYQTDEERAQWRQDMLKKFESRSKEQE